MKTKQHFLLFVLLLIAGPFALAAPQALTVTATDATSYQWYYNTDSSTNGATLISGATSSSYTPAQEGGPFYYFCVLTNTCLVEVKKDTSHISGAHYLYNLSACNDTSSIWGTVTYGDESNTDINTNTTTVGTQIWSAPVFVSGCDKTGFSGGSASPYNSACRRSHATNRSYFGDGANYGDLFSWCAVVRYATSLCPSPWRVPTNTDFQKLYDVLGNTPSKYYGSGSEWGGSYGGYCGASGTLSNQGSYGGYWASMQYSAAGYLLSFNASSVGPQGTNSKSYGYALRCVR